MTVRGKVFAVLLFITIGLGVGAFFGQKSGYKTGYSMGYKEGVQAKANEGNQINVNVGKLKKDATLKIEGNDQAVDRKEEATVEKEVKVKKWYQGLFD